MGQSGDRYRYWEMLDRWLRCSRVRNSSIGRMSKSMNHRWWWWWSLHLVLYLTVQNRMWHLNWQWRRTRRQGWREWPWWRPRCSQKTTPVGHRMSSKLVHNWYPLMGPSESWVQGAHLQHKARFSVKLDGCPLVYNWQNVNNSFNPVQWRFKWVNEPHSRVLMFWNEKGIGI